MKKSAQGIPWSVVAKALAGAGVGGVVGHEVTPRMFGYEDTPSARRAAMFINAALGAAVGAAGPAAVGQALAKPLREFKHYGHTKYIKQLAMPALAVAAGETVPIGQAALTQARRASEASAEAARTSSIPSAVQNLLQSGTVRGAGMGAAGAGLASILTGLARRRSEGELARQTPRGSMVGKDFLKYLLPAMAAGGVVGSLTRKNPPTA